MKWLTKGTLFIIIVLASLLVLVFFLFLIDVGIMTDNKSNYNDSLNLNINISKNKNMQLESDIREVIGSVLSRYESNFIIRDLIIYSLSSNNFQGYLFLECRGNINESIREKVASEIGRKINLWNIRYYNQKNYFWFDLFVCGKMDKGWRIDKNGFSPINSN